jgi:hypothetical protein
VHVPPEVRPDIGKVKFRVARGREEEKAEKHWEEDEKRQEAYHRLLPRRHLPHCTSTSSPPLFHRSSTGRRRCRHCCNHWDRRLRSEKVSRVIVRWYGSGRTGLIAPGCVIRDRHRIIEVDELNSRIAAREESRQGWNANSM